jgi:hypothetical protein
MMIHVSDEYAHDIVIARLQDDYEQIMDDIKIIEAMNRAGETNISIDKFYTVRDSIKNVLRYHMEEDLFYEWEDMINDE